MAEEDTTFIREIPFSPFPGSSTIDEMIRLLRDLTPIERIHLVLMFMDRDGFRFSETVELRELILEKKSNIHYLEVTEGFDFLIQFLWANNGETTKHFKYFNCFDNNVPMKFEQATELSNAIRSTNNGDIESFFFSGCCASNEVFQPVWDALLATCVRDLELFNHISDNNDINGGNTIDFSNISTNTSLKELKVGITLYGTNLFDSIKGNTTLEKLIVDGANLNDRGKRAFIKMLFENTTLNNVVLEDGDFNYIFREEINMHTTLNQIWKRLIIVKRKERMAAAATAAIRTTATNVAITAVDYATVERRREQDNNNEEVEKDTKIAEEKKMMKKKKEMNLWFQTFEKKPVICNELISLFLTDNAHLYNNNGTSTILNGVERKRKRQK